MIGIIFATDEEAAPFLEKDVPNVMVEISGVGLEAARLSSEKLVKKGAKILINAGICAGLHNRVKRGAVYRVASVFTEELKTAVNIGLGLSLKKLVSVEKPLHDVSRKKELAKDYDLLDMEGYAVARVCEQNNIPCLLLKAVTDFGDNFAKEDIKKFIKPTSKTLAKALLFALEGLSKSKKSSNNESLLRKIISFTKVEHTIFSLPLIFAGITLSNSPYLIFDIFLIFIAAIGARVFGMSLNRIFDRHIDKKNPRTSMREIPSGKLTVSQGVYISFFGLFLYLVSCYFLGDLAFKLCLIPLIPLFFYSLLKRFTYLCHFGIGLVLSLAPVCAYIAVSNSLYFSNNIIFLGLFSFFWMSGFDIIYALSDESFDKSYKIYSIPSFVGYKKSQYIAAFLHIVAFTFLVLLWVNLGGFLSLTFLIFSGIAFSLAYKQSIPLNVRFFPLSAIAGICGSMVVLLGELL